MVVVCIISCNNQHNQNALFINTTDLRNGDLIFREGPSFNSKVVRTLSDNQFSHVGMVYKHKGKWMVVHAVPDESETHETDYVKCESIESFLDPSKAKSSKFMRIKCSDCIALNAVKYAINKAKNKTLFDNDYDLGDTTRLYCTELVWQAYKHEGINLCPKFKKVTILGKTRYVIFPVDLLKSNFNKKEWI